jgi:phage-related protein
MKWNIILYETVSGQPVVQRFIDCLPKIPHAKLMRQIDLLEACGPDLGMPHTKPMGDGLIELRARGKLEVRVLYVFARGRRIYLLHGFIKKSPTTPRNELRIALKRKEEVDNL